MSISLFISSRFSNLLEYRFCIKEHIIFIKPLRISYIHTMYLYHIHFPLLLHSSQIYSHFPTIFCILFYRSLVNPVCAAHILKGRKSIYQRLCPLIKRTPFLKRHQLPIAPQLGLRSYEPLHTPRLHRVGLGWGLVSPSILHALLCGIGVRSCESLHCTDKHSFCECVSTAVLSPAEVTVFSCFSLISVSISSFINLGLLSLSFA